MIKKIGQLFFIGIEGTELSDAEADFIVNNNIGGVTLFSRNIKDLPQVHHLCTELSRLGHRMVDKVPLFISVDMEGGRVQRFGPPFTQWPPLKKVGDLDSTSMAFQFGLCMGAELRAVGINLNFAPCVDVLTNPENVIIGDRALSSDPEVVGKLCSALVRGYIKSGILPCAKHFPGHGNTFADSHEELPEESIELETLMKRELVPFRKALRARLDFLMTGHIKFSKIDPEWPVTLSEKFIRGILKGEFRYKGLVVTDDLNMKALSNHYETSMIPVQALKAGCDLLLYCNDPNTPPIALEAVAKAVTDGVLDSKEINEIYHKVLKLKKEKIVLPEPLPLAKVTEILSNPQHELLVQIFENGVIPEELKSTFKPG